jgi:hypothetical protein
MSQPHNENLKKLLRLTQEMLALSDEGDRDRNDSSCGILYGILRDAGYRLRKLAEEECEKHRHLGKWD